MKKFIITMLTALTILCPSFTAQASTYHIAHSSTISWSASYDIKTKGDNITEAYNIHTHAYIGKIISKTIKKNKSNQVTLYMTRLVGTIRYKVHLTATIKNKRITVSVS